MDKALIWLLITCVVILVLLYILNIFDSPWTPKYSKNPEDLLLRQGFTPLSSIADVKFFSKGINAMDSIIKDIRNEKKYINVSFYSMRMSDESRAFINALIDAVKRKVKVRFVYDFVGRSDGIQRLKEAGGEVVKFYPFSNILNTFSLRNHDKYIMLGNRILYMSSFVISKESLQNWVESSLRITGDFSDSALDSRIMNSLIKEAYSMRRLYIPFWCSKKIAYGIYADLYLNTILNAKKSIYIINPYFVPPDEITNALIEMSHKITIKALVLSKSDHPIIREDAIHLIRYILSKSGKGITFYEYPHKHVHSKIMLADDDVVVFGSGNLDYRSLFQMHEVGMYIRDPELSATIKKHFDELVKDSKVENKPYGLYDKAIVNIFGKNDILRNVL